MKITLNIDSTVMARLKCEVGRQERTMSELVEAALRMLFRLPKRRGKLSPLPRFRSGGALVDVADRDALYQAMEGSVVLVVEIHILPYGVNLRRQELGKRCSLSMTSPTTQVNSSCRIDPKKIIVCAPVSS
jgi:hypothetical protein